MGIKVKAIRQGYYKNIIRNIDEVFMVDGEVEIGLWMERLDGVKKSEKTQAEIEKIEVEKEDAIIEAALKAEEKAIEKEEKKKHKKHASELI